MVSLVFEECKRDCCPKLLMNFNPCLTVTTAGQNEGPVCAFDNKCGDIREFDSKEDAHLANYEVAHCGPCANCSTWNDMELQYSTRVSFVCPLFIAVVGHCLAHHSLSLHPPSNFSCRKIWQPRLKNVESRQWVEASMGYKSA